MSVPEGDPHAPLVTGNSDSGDVCSLSQCSLSFCGCELGGSHWQRTAFSLAQWRKIVPVIPIAVPEYYRVFEQQYGECRHEAGNADRDGNAGDWNEKECDCSERDWNFWRAARASPGQYCYQYEDAACGVCVTVVRLRLQALFAEAGVP